MNKILSMKVLISTLTWFAHVSKEFDMYKWFSENVINQSSIHSFLSSTSIYDFLVFHLHSDFITVRKMSVNQADSLSTHR